MVEETSYICPRCVYCKEIELPSDGKRYPGLVQCTHEGRAVRCLTGDVFREREKEFGVGYSRFYNSTVCPDFVRREPVVEGKLLHKPFCWEQYRKVKE